MAEREIKVQPLLIELNISVVYFPQLGYLLVVPKTPELEKKPDMEGLQFHVSGGFAVVSSVQAVYIIGRMLSLSHSSCRLSMCTIR